MLSSDAASNWPVPSASSPHVGAVRLAVGFLHGVVLYLLYQAMKDKAWPATEPLLLGPLLLVCLIVPVIFISSLGALERRQLLLWIPAAAAVLAALGLYDAWRVLGPNAVPATARDNPVHLSGQLVLVSTVGFFIAQSLVLAAAGERRRIASYYAYFETARNHFVQLSFSGLFVGVVWLVCCWVRSILLINLNFLRDLIHEAWFVTHRVVSKMPAIATTCDYPASFPGKMVSGWGRERCRRCQRTDVGEPRSGPLRRVEGARGSKMLPEALQKTS